MHSCKKYQKYTAGIQLKALIILEANPHAASAWTQHDGNLPIHTYARVVLLGWWGLEGGIETNIHPSDNQNCAWMGSPLLATTQIPGCILSSRDTVSTAYHEHRQILPDNTINHHSSPPFLYKGNCLSIWFYLLSQQQHRITQLSVSISQPTKRLQHHADTWRQKTNQYFDTNCDAKSLQPRQPEQHQAAHLQNCRKFPSPKRALIWSCVIE